MRLMNILYVLILHLGNQGNQWKRAVINVASAPPGHSTYRLLIEGVVGDGTTGDISVDDMSAESGICIGSYLPCLFL